MLVRQLMTSNVKSCSPEDTLDVVGRRLWDGDVGALVVVSGTHAVGMITDRDVCMAAYTQRRPLHELVVSSAMSRELHTVRPEDPVDTALRVMKERQVRRLAVVDDAGRPRGLVSMNDLVRESTRPRSTLAPAAVVQALAEVGAPRASAAGDRPAAPALAAARAE